MMLFLPWGIPCAHSPCTFQQGLRDSTAKCRSLEEQLLSLRLSEGDKDCQLKELEYSKRALEQEIQSLKLQVRAHLAGCSLGPRLRGISVGKLMMKTLCKIKTGSLLQSCSSPTLQTTTDELSSRYVEMINNLREDKDREIRSLRVRGSAGTGCVQGQLLLQLQQQRSTTSTFWVSSGTAVTLLIDSGDGSKPLQ